MIGANNWQLKHSLDPLCILNRDYATETCWEEVKVGVEKLYFILENITQTN